MPIINNTHDLLTVFMALTITLTVVSLIFLTAIGIAHLTNEMFALLIGTVTTTGFVVIIRTIFGKVPDTPVTEIEKTES